MLLRLPIIILLGFFTALPAAYASEADALSQAKTNMQAGRYALVIDDLRQVIAERHDDYQAWFLFGVAHAHEQQYQQAIEAFRQVITLRPDLAEPHNNLAAVYNALGDPKAAVKELESALKKRPNYPVAEENIANLYVELALRHYRSSLEQSANPIIEQRYARLLNVRNPIGDNPSNEAEKSSSAKPSSPTTKAVTEKPKSSPSAPIIAKVKATVVAPAATPKVAQAPEVDTSITGVLDALETWREAWSAQDLTGYFSAYSAHYVPEARFPSLQAWKKYKTRVIGNKKFIKIDFEQVNVDMQAGSNTATILMMQRFRSNSYNGDGFKRITMKRGSNGWKITNEASVK